MALSIGTDMVAKLLGAGWTMTQIDANYNVGGPAAAPLTNVHAGDPPPAAAGNGYSGLGLFPWETPAGVGFRAPWTAQNGGGGGGDPAQAAIAALGTGGALAGLGLAGLALPLAGAYGVSQALGVQYPWETGPGEGFISPFSRDIVKDEAGQWVTRQTRPDLFAAGGVNGNGNAAAAIAMGGGAPGFRKTWTANGWPFAMTTDALGKNKRIHTVRKDGTPVSWRPYRSIVLGKKLSAGQAKRAVRKLQGIKDLAEEITKLGGTRTVYRKAKD